MEVKVLIDPTLWDTARGTLEDIVMALVVTGSTIDRLDMEVRSATMGSRGRWPMVKTLAPASLIQMDPVCLRPRGISIRKRYVLGN